MVVGSFMPRRLATLSREGERVAVCSERLLQRVDQIGPLPAEEVAFGLAAEMAVARGLLIDRLVEAEMGADALGGEADELGKNGFDPRFVHGSGAMGVDIERE